MTVAEQIKRSTKHLTIRRALKCRNNCIKSTILAHYPRVGVLEYLFIDGSKLTCRVYL